MRGRGRDKKGEIRRGGGKKELKMENELSKKARKRRGREEEKRGEEKGGDVGMG